MRNKRLLSQGIVGLARAGATTWFHGHFGGAAITAAFLLERDDLSAEVKEGIQDQLGRAMTEHAAIFEPFPAQTPDPGLEARIIEALKPNLERLCISGHGVIYGALALRALRQVPELLQPAIVDGIVSLLALSTKDRPNRYYGMPDSGADLLPYETERDMIRASFGEVKEVFKDGTVDGNFYYFAAEKLHAFTHAHALVTLSALGHGDLARLGYESHREQLRLNRMTPPNPEERRADRSSGLTPYDAAYWRRDHFDDHILKLACAGLELLDRMPGNEKTALYHAESFWGPFMR